jgi:ferredoxin-type protein NapG
MNRRNLLGGLGAALGGVAAGLVARQARAQPALRPPGAGPDPEFDARCIRCFRCSEVCPVSAIHFDGAVSVRGDLPAIHAARRGCTLCMQCTWACPTGALHSIPAEPATVQRTVRMGTPVLNRDACLAWSGAGVCRACYFVCPYPDSAITLNGPRLAPLFSARDCTGCGLCEEACPQRARAIHIEPKAGP